MLRKKNQTMEFSVANKQGDTDHILYDASTGKNPPPSYRSDCWCEPRHVMCKNLKLHGRLFKGWWKVILHDGKWFKPTFAPTNKLDALYRTLQEPPEGGWDRIMDQESIDDLIESVLKQERKEVILVQRKKESVQDYYKRVKDAINSGITDLRYETNDPDAFAELLERDDDFETEIDEEE